MAQILIRNIDGAVISALRQRAALSGISMEEQARRALAKAVRRDRRCDMPHCRNRSQAQKPG